MPQEKNNKLKYVKNNCKKQLSYFLFNSEAKHRDLLYVKGKKNVPLNCQGHVGTDPQQLPHVGTVLSQW